MIATSAPALRKTPLRTAVLASRWRHIPTRCPLKTLVAANLREILPSTGMFACAHASLTRPDGASAESLTRLKTCSRSRAQYSNYIWSSVQIFQSECQPFPQFVLDVKLSDSCLLPRPERSESTEAAAMYNKERGHATVKLTGSIRE